MSDLVISTTGSTRVRTTGGARGRLHGVRAWDAELAATDLAATDLEATELSSPADDRLRRRELFLHHLELERQRRRRRSA